MRRRATPAALISPMPNSTRLAGSGTKMFLFLLITMSLPGVLAAAVGLRTLGQRPRVVILRMRRMPFLDASGAAALDQFVDQATGYGIRVIFSGVQPPAMAVLARTGLGRESVRVQHASDYPAALAKAKAAVSD